MITEHASVVLTENLPAVGLEAGDVGVVALFTVAARLTRWNS